MKNKSIFHLLCILLLGIPALAQPKTKQAEDYFELGENACLAGQYKQAIVYLNQCLYLSPGYAEAYFTRGMAKERMEDWQGAMTDYNIALELHPNIHEVLLSRGTVRYKLGLYKQAEDDFIKLLSLPPPGETTTIFYRQAPFGSGTTGIMTAASADKSYLFNYIGLAETKLKNFNRAIHYFDSAISADPGEPSYYINRGIAKENLNDSTAISDYHAALQVDPDNALAKHNLAVLSAKYGNTSSLESKLTEALESDSTLLYAYIERAYQRLQSGYLKGALKDYNAAINLDHSDPETWLGRGIVKEKLKDYEGAYSDYTQALVLDEKFEKAWLNRGNLFSRLGQYEKAIEDYTRAVTFNATYASAFYNRAIALQRLKKNKEACDDLQKAEALGMTINAAMKSKFCK